MTPDEFRQAGVHAVDWLARYMAEVERSPVLSRVRPGEARARLPTTPPEQPEPFDALLRDLDELLPGITHWQSPNFFAYFPANTSGPSALGELLAAGLGVQGMLWATSPACTELEQHVLDWMVDLLALPAAFRSTGPGGGVIQDSASSAALCSLVAARERASGGTASDHGTPSGLVAYASEHAHSSIEKALMIAGLGAANLRKLPTDARHALRPDALAQALAADRAARRTPCWVVATVGTTSSLAVDPLRALGEVCRANGVWLHVDAAMAGVAALCPEHRALHDGLELADSYCTNAHKWLPVNFDCDLFYVADRDALTRPLRMTPEYLRNQPSDSGGVTDYRDWQVPLGRRFRALKLWFVLRSFGAENLRAMIRRHVDWAGEFARRVQADDRLELAAPVSLNLVCFRHRDGDAATERLMERLNASGEMYLTHTKLNGRFTLRMCIGQATTERRHVERAWELITENA